MLRPESSAPANVNRRRPARCSGSAAPAPEAGRLPDRSGEFAKSGAGTPAEPRIRRAADGPELCPRHHFRPGGSGPAGARAETRSHAARDGDDRLGQHPAGGGSHAARRGRFRREALGQYQAAFDLARRRSRPRNERRSGAARESGEIEAASATQRGLLPQSIPQFPGYGISAAWRPAGAVSGDYLDLLRLDANHLALCVADVIGKGVPAALLMSNVQAAVHALAGEMLPTGELCGRINRIVAANVGSGKFITFFYGVLDGARRRFSYTNAGHCEPILVRSERRVHARESWRRGAGRFPGLVVPGRACGSRARRPAGAVHRRHHRDRQRRRTKSSAKSG